MRRALRGLTSGRTTSGSSRPSIEQDPLEAVRKACAWVSTRARYVRIDELRLGAYARAFPRAELEAAQPLCFPGLGDDPEERCGFVLALDAINFGSGYWPWLRKRPGLSGYRTIEASLLDRVRTHGPLTAADLASTTPEHCAAIFGQTMSPPIDTLMNLFARAWRELGALVEARHAGRFVALVENASGLGARLVGELLELSLFRDIALYDDRPVPLLKRAQIAVADLAATLPAPLGSFSDLDRLTIFADNLVPHVLRLDGVLHFDPGLAARIDSEDLIAPGSPEEVEIRACAVHAVERLSLELHALGHPIPPHELDRWLWTRGGSPTYKSRPRHRSRSCFY